MHTPVDHPLRPFYRTLAALGGVYLVVFGVVGLVSTGDQDAVGRSDASVLGQGSNLTASVISLALGAIVLIGVLIGRNVDVALNTYLGWGLIGIGTLSMLFSHTDLNVLNSTIFTCVVSYIVGLVLVTAGLYGKTGVGRPHAAEHADHPAVAPEERATV